MYIDSKCDPITQKLAASRGRRQQRSVVGPAQKAAE